MDEAFPEAAAILRTAGWTPHDTWGVYTHGTLVMGSPKLGEFHVKNTARCADSPETPDDPVAAAQWLVARFPIVSEPEPEETPAYENDTQAGAYGDAAQGEGQGVWDGGNTPSDAPSELADEPLLQDSEAEIRQESLEPDPLGSEILDADFSEPTDPPPEDSPSGAFIFGDNLEQQRTAAIGLVVQAAMDRMPAAIDYTRMSELRNFVMGVSEGRWPDDPALRDELAALEATESQRRAVESARDAKVAYLVSATREEIAAFDPEANWP